LAQIIDFRELNGKQVTCVVSGLHSWQMPCGFDEGYEQIFLGTIMSVSRISDRESELQLRPEEVLYGAPQLRVTAETGQGDCLPDLQVGDQWLFYLRRDDATHKLTLWYGSGSAPVRQAEAAIEFLRHLRGLESSGVILGAVSRLDEDDNGAQRYTQVVNHSILAKAKKDGTVFTAVSDTSGCYEFTSLPSGEYDLTSNTKSGLWSEEGTVRVKPRSCASVNFQLEPDGIVSGYLRQPDEKPLPYVEIALIPATKGYRFITASSDGAGHFEFRGVPPGTYVIGAGFPDGQLDHAQMYYPGVSLRSSAQVIEIGQAEKKGGFEFHLLTSFIPK
jgi:hypothetical protein